MYRWGTFQENDECSIELWEWKFGHIWVYIMANKNYLTLFFWNTVSQHMPLRMQFQLLISSHFSSVLAIDFCYTIKWQYSNFDLTSWKQMSPFYFWLLLKFWSTEKDVLSPYKTNTHHHIETVHYFVFYINWLVSKKDQNELKKVTVRTQYSHHTENGDIIPSTSQLSSVNVMGTKDLIALWKQIHMKVVPVIWK